MPVSPELSELVCDAFALILALLRAVRGKIELPHLRLIMLVRLAARACALQLGLGCVAQTAATYHQRADQALQSFLLKF